MFTESLKKIIIYLFVFLILSFLIFQLFKLNSREQLIINNFSEKDTLVLKKDNYEIQGKTHAVKKLFVNGKEYFLDENNNFRIRLELFNGYNEFNFVAETESDSKIKRKIIIFKM